MKTNFSGRALHTAFSSRTARFVLPTACALAVTTGCHRAANSPGGVAAVPKKTAPTASPVTASVPLPPLPPGGVKGIYLTGWTAGGTKSLNKLCALADRTEINAMVIDVKDDGQLSYEADVPLAKSAHASLKMYDVDKVIATLNAHHIWPIARIACMRDTPLVKAHPELAVHGPDGQVWHDRSRHYWLNPYKKEVWDYNVDVALDAIKHGFKEIQFDYVRFPSEGKISTLQYPGKPPNVHRAEQITAFMKYAEQKIHAQGAWFSADVFGLTSTVERRYDRSHPRLTSKGAGLKKAGTKAGVAASVETPGVPSAPTTIPAATPVLPARLHVQQHDDSGTAATPGVTPSSPAPHGTPVVAQAKGGTDKIAQDMGIGQHFSDLAAHVDYMCPMCYPSHYAHGEFGIANPNAEPYKVIMKSVGDSKKLMADVPTCKLRPWIQDFSLGPPHYGPTEVKAQIKALNDLGIHEFLLWNARCRYTEAAFARKTPAKVAATK